MGTITRSFANNIGTSGILKAGAFNNASLNNVTALNAAIATGNMVLLSTQTASDSASLSFTTGIDSTYKEYQFWFIDIYPRSNAVNFTINFSTDSGSNYNVAKTTTMFEAAHNEGGSQTIFGYQTGYDAAQSTGYVAVSQDIGNGADKSMCGSMSLFNPASTTYVKHFIANCNSYQHNDFSFNCFVAGYGNTTSAINAVRFQASSGNFDGTILLFGIK